MKKKTLLNEVRQLQKIAGILKEDIDPAVMDQIERWYWNTNPRADNMSQEEVERALADHYDEWMKSKHFYDGNIQAYFDEVERNGGWY